MQYQDAPYSVKTKMLWWQKQGLQQTATGYGSKLTTPYMVTLPNEKRAYRVYAICYSNVASYYIVRKGETLFLRDGELQNMRDAEVSNASL